MDGIGLELWEHNVFKPQMTLQPCAVTTDWVPWNSMEGHRRPRLVKAWPRLVKAWLRLVKACQGLAKAWPRLAKAWPRLARAWSRLARAWPRLAKLAKTIQSVGKLALDGFERL